MIPFLLENVSVERKRHNSERILIKILTRTPKKDVFFFSWLSKFNHFLDKFVYMMIVTIKAVTYSRMNSSSCSFGLCMNWSLLCIDLWASQVVLVLNNSPANAGDLRDVGLIPGSGRCPGGGHGTPLQYLCLENPMDRGAWQAMAHRVANSWMQLSMYIYL